MCQESLLYPDVFGLPVYYITTHWEEALRPEQDTWPEVRDLLQAVATRHDRWDQLCEIDTHHEHSKLRIGPGTSVDQQGSRAETLSRALHGAIRRYRKRTGALIVGKGWFVGADGEQRRRIELRQDKQKKTTSGQLAKVEKALNSKSEYRIEAAYWGLTASTIELIKQAVIEAGAHRALVEYNATGIVMARLQTRQMHDPELLRLVMPFARNLLPRRGVHSAKPRDELLGTILRTYQTVSGSKTTAARRGGFDGPDGPGTEFVREIEKIFGTYVMPAASTHAIRRALELFRPVD
jgi:hypothetical protein